MKPETTTPGKGLRKGGNGNEKINDRKKRAPVSVLHWDYLFAWALHTVRLNSPPLRSENGGQDESPA